MANLLLLLLWVQRETSFCFGIPQLNLRRDHHKQVPSRGFIPSTYTTNNLWNPCPCQVEIDRLADLFDSNGGVTITTWKYCTNTVKIGKVAYLLSWEGGGSDVWAEHTSWRHYYCKSVPSCNRSVNLRTGQSISDDNASQVSLQHRYKVGVGAEH